jgi:hypothetical protein
MALEVINREEWLSRGKSNSLAGEKCDHHSSDESWSRRCSNGIDIVNRYIRLAEYLLDDSGQDLNMGTSRDLRDDAAKRLMRTILPDNRLSQDHSLVGYQRSCAVVAAALKAKYYGHFVSGPLP